MDELKEISRRLDEIEKMLPFAMAPNGDCLTVREVAAWIGCTPETVRKHERDGMLVARFPMAAKRFHPHDVGQFMRGRTVRKSQKSDHQADGKRSKAV